MSLDKIQKLVGSLAKSLEDNEGIATPVLAAKLEKANRAFPEDQTIGSMSRVISKMADNNTMFISRGNLKSLYHKLHSRNTKFAELFQDELGIKESLPTPQIYNRDESKEINTYEVGDTILANALTSMFDNAPLKMFSQTTANKVLSSVASSLDAWNLKPVSIVVDSGNEKFLVVRADYDTPKGITSLFIPVETPKNKILEASVFMGNTGPQELNHTSIKSYLKANAGTKSKISGSSILNVLTKAATENKEINEVELALTKLTATRQGKSEFFQNSIIGQKVAEEAQQDVKLEKSDEFNSFEQQFTSPQGQAAWQFGAEKVATARNHIIRELTGYGHKNPQVTISKNDDSTIYYNVSLDAGRVGFVVPVKLANNKIIKPSIMLCNGSIGDFSQEGINALYVQNHSDFRAAAGASTLSALKPSEVLKNLRDALAEGNHAVAEDALNVLSHSGDGKAYAIGFQTYMSGLAAKTASTHEHVKCAHARQSKTSEHPICAQTGLPTHKIYQDQDGNCRPLYRRGMDETYEGAVFNNSKIFG